MKSQKQIYLAVSGIFTDYSNEKTDFFDVSGLFQNKSVILPNFAAEYTINDEQTILHQPSPIESKEKTIKKLTKERDTYKAQLSQIKSKYENLKEKLDQLQNQSKKVPEANESQKTESEIMPDQIGETTTIKTKKPLIKNCLLWKAL